MIFALELKHFKTYNKKQYILISNLSERFSIFIGDNGYRKIEFAKDINSIPEWINEIKKFFGNT